MAVLLTLLHLGVKNIRLGPNLPAFLTPQATQVRPSPICLASWAIIIMQHDAAPGVCAMSARASKTHSKAYQQAPPCVSSKRGGH